MLIIVLCGAPQWLPTTSQCRNAKKYYDKKSPDDAEPTSRRDKGEKEKPPKKDKKSKKSK